MVIPVEFQAVVMAAGKGSRMTELTLGKPKCLLPVGNKPLIWYSLYNLQRIGFTEVIIVVLENHKSQVEEAIDKQRLNLKIDYLEISYEDDLGTADSLKLLQDKILLDVIIVSCDLITDTSLRGMIDLFRMHDASTTSLFLHPHKQDSSQLPGPKSKHKVERDLIGVDTHTNRLVFQASVSDFEDSVSLHHALLRKHPNLKIYSNLVDAHIYILKKWVVKYLANVGNMSSIKGELIPHIVKKQLARQQQVPTNLNGSIVTPADRNDIFELAKEDPLTLKIRSMSSYNDHFEDLMPVYHDNPIRCYAFIASPKDFGIRVNTLLSYWAINKQIKHCWESITKRKEITLRSPDADIQSNQVDDECIIWEGAKLSEKTSFKNSIIGSNTEVSSFSRVFNSIVMNNVIIKEKVAVENCIICDGVTIESGTKLKNCIVGSQHTVLEKSDYSNDVLTESAKFIEL